MAERGRESENIYSSENENNVSNTNIINLSSENIQNNEINTIEEDDKFILYWIHGSISSWRILFLFHEENIKFKAIRLKIMKKDKDTKQESFLKLNHRGKAPVLVDRTFKYQPREVVLNESLAIVQYFDRIYLNEKYMGVGTEYYHSILIKKEETNNLLEAYEPLEELFHTVNDIHLMKEIIKAYPRLQKELKYWEKYASQNEYIASPFLSEADIAFFPILDYIDYRGFKLDQTMFPHLHRYYHFIRTAHERTRNLAYPPLWHLKRGRQRNLYTCYLKLVDKYNKPKQKNTNIPKKEKRSLEKNNEGDPLDFMDAQW